MSARTSLSAVWLHRPRVGGALVALTLFVAACSIEDAFVGTRARRACEGNLPVCRVRAGCVLDGSGYIEGNFPGGRRLVVVSDGEADVTVSLFLRDEVWPGSSLEMRFYEPGCSRSEEWFAELDDLFVAAGADRIVSATQRLREAGEHLIEVRSDAYAAYDLKVDVQ